MKIIGLAYKKGVGKNTLAKFIITYLRCEMPGLNVKEISFAAKLKDISYQLYSWAGLQRAIYYESHRDEKEVVLPLIKKSPREIWIDVGNKLREVYVDTWIDFALKEVKADVLIVSDVRFCNEAEAIKDVGGTLIKINRFNIPQGVDPAEVDLDIWKNWDEIVNNDSTLQHLCNLGEVIARDLLKCLQNEKNTKVD